jgi:hypothetical protein
MKNCSGIVGYIKLQYKYTHLYSVKFRRSIQKQILCVYYSHIKYNIREHTQGYDWVVPPFPLPHK